LRWNETRGHCHKILNIYAKYLNKWFSRVLNPDENKQMHSLFREFVEFEGGFIDNLDKITEWLAKNAKDTLDLLDKSKIEEVNKKVRNARKDTLHFREKMNEAMRQMLDLQAEFIKLTGAV
jgi:hypothetical protein